MAGHIPGSVTHTVLLGLGIQQNVERILEATAVTVTFNHHHGWPVGDVAGFSITAVPLSLSIVALSLSLSFTTKENGKWEAEPLTTSAFYRLPHENHHTIITAKRVASWRRRLHGLPVGDVAGFSIKAAPVSLSIATFSLIPRCKP